MIRSAGRGGNDPRYPRTAVKIEAEEEYDRQERGDCPGSSGPESRYSDIGRDERSNRGSQQPHVDNGRDRDDPHLYERRGSVVFETYDGASETRRSTSRYYPARGRDSQEEHNLEPEGRDDAASMTAGFRTLRIEDEANNYGLYQTAAPPSSTQEASSPAEVSSYNAKQYDKYPACRRCILLHLLWS